MEPLWCLVLLNNTENQCGLNIKGMHLDEKISVLSIAIISLRYSDDISPVGW